MIKIKSLCPVTLEALMLAVSCMLLPPERVCERTNNYFGDKFSTNEHFLNVLLLST